MYSCEQLEKTLSILSLMKIAELLYIAEGCMRQLSCHYIVIFLFIGNNVLFVTNFYIFFVSICSPIIWLCLNFNSDIETKWYNLINE